MECSNCAWAIRASRAIRALKLVALSFFFNQWNQVFFLTVKTLKIFSDETHRHMFNPFSPLCQMNTNDCALALTAARYPHGTPPAVNVAGFHMQMMSECRDRCGPRHYYPVYNPFYSPVGAPEQRLLNYNAFQSRPNQHHQQRHLLY